MGLPMRRAAWAALALVAVLSAICCRMSAWDAARRQPGPICAGLLGSPFRTAVMQWLVAGADPWCWHPSVSAAPLAARDSLPDAVLLVVWLQSILLMLQVVQLVLHAGAAAAGRDHRHSCGLVLFLWLLTPFVAELHGFRSSGRLCSGIVLRASAGADPLASVDDPRPRAGGSEPCMTSPRSAPTFPILSRQVNGKPLVYLDNGASAQKPQVVIDAVTQAYSEEYANVHRGLHYLSTLATEKYEAVRGIIARFLNAGSEEEIVFTTGTTEGDQPGVLCLGRAAPAARRRDRAVDHGASRQHRALALPARTAGRGAEMGRDRCQRRSRPAGGD